MDTKDTKEGVLIQFRYAESKAVFADDDDNEPRAAVSWSGGKDSCAALQRAWPHFDVVAMVTMFDEDAARSRSHGLRPEVLAAQAERLGLGQVIGRCTWPTYNDAFGDALDRLKADGITHVVFGDILFDEHRRWAEEMCAPRGLVAVEPLFGGSTRESTWRAHLLGPAAMLVEQDVAEDDVRDADGFQSIERVTERVVVGWPRATADHLT